MCRIGLIGKVARAVFVIAALFPAFADSAQAEDKPKSIPDISTILMESTYLIYGPKKGDSTKSSFGTAFLMGKPAPDKTKAYYVLITAAHVLENIDGEIGTLKLREKQGDGSYTPRLWKIKLRAGDQALYVRHKDADVVALYVAMPNNLSVTILPTNLLADDEVLKKFEIHPGDELLCLGYPLLASSDAGFPILRSGKIASYPITPTKLNKGFFYDFRDFEGNSGGPVYFVDHGRTYGGITHIRETEQFVVGLVTSQLTSRAYDNQKLELAMVVPSSFIRETIDLLPATSPYK
ncbi:MAG: serine protease [Steroidobacteraceae bacterium]